MDVAACLQRFESSVSSYDGDDPLEPWDRFVDFLQQRLPSDSTSQLSLVLNRLVEKFLNVDKYANDERYINYCIKCAGYYSDPIALYSHVFSKGVGSRNAALYISWAQQFEQKGMNDQAEAVFQKALENQAQPADSVLHEYRQFQSRTKPHVAETGGRNPLQNSNLTNVMSTEPSSNKDSADDCQLVKPAERRYVVMVSRSEYSGKIPASSNENTVAAYDKEALECEDSELCFEEVRAQRYFQKIKEQQQQEEEASPETTTILNATAGQLEVYGPLKLKMCLEELQQFSTQEGFEITEATQNLETLSVAEAASKLVPDVFTHQPLGRPPLPSKRLSSRKSLGLWLHAEPTFVSNPIVTSEPDTMTPAASLSQHAPVPAASSLHHYLSVIDEKSVHVPEQEPVNFEQMNVSLHKTQQESEQVLQQQITSEDCPHQEADKYNGDWEQLQHGLEELDKLNMSQGGTANLSHITPNNSLGYIQATPSRVLPSPTVNTREALDVIMDMFQAPTMLEDPFPNSSVETGFDVIYTKNGSTVTTKPATSAPFTIFEDDNEKEDKENCSALPAAASENVKPIRALSEIPVPKPNKPNVTPTELTSDESTVWGARFNSHLAACPNSTSDFAMLAQFVSTPFTHKTPAGNGFFPEQDNCEGTEEEGFMRRQVKKLSPIMEQSPSEEKLNDTGVSKILPSAHHGTIVGEGLQMNSQLMTTSCTTLVQPPPPTVLSFREQTLCPTNNSLRKSTGPGWSVYTSPESKPKSEPFTIVEDLEEPQPSAEPKPSQDVPMSPESAHRPDWFTIQSPMITAEEDDLDVFLSPHRPGTLQKSLIIQDVPMSPQVDFNTDAQMMSPDKDIRPCLDVSMNHKTPRRSRAGPMVPLVSDPWNDNLIAHLLSNMDPPLTSHPYCVTWQCNLPDISPKMTLSFGNASLRVDCILGEGAFAKVYLATDPVTSEKIVLKVQKPANPWEFYINTQLDSRVPPTVRHFYSSLQSAHIFRNGSVLLGELHNYGTLLNAVNIYRTLGDKVMPQPLVMYFTICILHMVEQLHSVGIIHADIKPDNFLLGERFLENRGFDFENLEHGLVLIDLGQSIDMSLFPQNTAFTAKCLTSGFQCTEMQTGRPWNYQTDYFGIAGTVYCMLFGTYMQVINDGGVWKTNGVFRRNPHSDLWQEVFHTLLNVPDCSSLPNLSVLRHKLIFELEQNYKNKLSSLKSRLVVLLLESSRKAGRR